MKLKKRTLFIGLGAISILIPMTTDLALNSANYNTTNISSVNSTTSTNPNFTLPSYNPNWNQYVPSLSLNSYLGTMSMPISGFLNLVEQGENNPINEKVTPSYVALYKIEYRSFTDPNTNNELHVGGVKYIPQENEPTYVTYLQNRINNTILELNNLKNGGVEDSKGNPIEIPSSMDEYINNFTNDLNNISQQLPDVPDDAIVLVDTNTQYTWIMRTASIMNEIYTSNSSNYNTLFNQLKNAYINSFPYVFGFTTDQLAQQWIMLLQQVTSTYPPVTPTNPTVNPATPIWSQPNESYFVFQNLNGGTWSTPGQQNPPKQNDPVNMDESLGKLSLPSEGLTWGQWLGIGFGSIIGVVVLAGAGVYIYNWRKIKKENKPLPRNK